MFLTPSLKVIKKMYPDMKITVNTHRPRLLDGNPFVDHVGTDYDGLKVIYMDPFHCKSPDMLPTKHHILTYWEAIIKHYELVTLEPMLYPELYCLSEKNKRSGIGVQVDFKPHWHYKRVWPYSQELIRHGSVDGHEIKPISYFPTVLDLVSFIADLKLVVCSQGGVQQIAAAVKTPAIVIYGGFSKPEWDGYSFQRNIINEKPCSPCYGPHPCVSQVERECMREISVEMVIEAIREEIVGCDSWLPEQQLSQAAI